MHFVQIQIGGRKDCGASAVAFTGASEDSLWISGLPSNPRTPVTKLVTVYLPFQKYRCFAHPERHRQPMMNWWQHLQCNESWDPIPSSLSWIQWIEGRHHHTPVPLSTGRQVRTRFNQATTTFEAGPILLFFILGFPNWSKNIFRLWYKPWYKLI